MMSGADEMYGGGDTQVGKEIVLSIGGATPIAASFTAGAGERAAAIEYDGGQLTLR